MSVSEDREVTPAVSPAAPAASIADPGPLGLAAFALTTFLLSAVNAHWTNGNSAGTAFLGYALAYVVRFLSMNQMMMEMIRIVRLHLAFVRRTASAEILVNMGGVVVDDDNHPAGLAWFPRLRT